MKQSKKVIIIGAGISGLTAAKILKQQSYNVLVIEASDDVGGRVKTDKVNGFLLDRGFQVLLTAYPLAKEFLNYKDLQLKEFQPGAKILYENGITEIMDPLKQPLSIFKTLLSPAGSFIDKFLMLKLKQKLSKQSIDTIFKKKEQTTANLLVEYGFSKRMIKLFFKPFLAGIFLEKELQTSGRMFDFVFKMFSEAPTAIPAYGMQQIPKQLAACLNKDEILFNTKISKIDNGSVITEKGEIFKADVILIACGEEGLPQPFQSKNSMKQSVSTVYFTASKTPFKAPVIALNALSNKFVNNIAVMSQVSSHYATNKNISLISVSLIGDHSFLTDEAINQKIKLELSKWFKDVYEWEHLKTYHIPYALPNQSNVENTIDSQNYFLKDNIYRCGDYLLNGSINAAMQSGKTVANMIIKNT